MGERERERERERWRRRRRRRVEGRRWQHRRVWAQPVPPTPLEVGPTAPSTRVPAHHKKRSEQPNTNQIKKTQKHVKFHANGQILLIRSLWQITLSPWYRVRFLRFGSTEQLPSDGGHVMGSNAQNRAGKLSRTVPSHWSAPTTTSPLLDHC